MLSKMDVRIPQIDARRHTYVKIREVYLRQMHRGFKIEGAR